MVERVLVVAVLCAAAPLAGCTGGGTPTAGAPSSTVSGPAESSTPVAAAPTDGGAVEATPPPTPATTAGPLTRADLPAPTDLGEGWAAWVDPGDIADGYAGNGTDVRERQPREVTDALAPLGCAGLDAAPDLALPDHALEATFRTPDGRAAVALVLEYADPATAAATLATLGDALRRCPAAAPGEDPGPYRLVVDVERADDGVLVDQRSEQGLQAGTDRWLEVGVRVGDRLGLTSLQLGDSGAPEPDALADALRRVTGG